MTVEEGQKYYLRNFNFVGMKLFRTSDLIAKSVFGMSPGDVFSTQKLQKGIENLRKLYGDFGYIDFVPEPDPEPVPGGNNVDLTINVDEGKQFFVRRIDFPGNSTTRDKVIRRELLIDERSLQHRFGSQHSAAESVGLFRTDEARRCSRSETRYQDKYG